MAVHASGNGRVVAIRLSSAAVAVASVVAATVLGVHGHERTTVVVAQDRPVGDGSAVAQPGAAAVPVPPPLTAPKQAAMNPPPAVPNQPPAVPNPPAAVALAPGAAVRLPNVGPARPAAGASSQAGSAPRDGSVPLSERPSGLAAALQDTGDTPQPPCPLGWPTPREQGGLASLIGLAPLAGSFSSEAFALGSVYQPILRLAGPLLAEIAPVLASYQPLIDPVITRVQGVEALVLQAILPYYGPYRGQLIHAESDLAIVLAPVLERAYHSEVASCLVAWEGQLVAAAKGQPMPVASLAHPGSVVMLGPRR